jgi:hypothetical protein
MNDAGKGEIAAELQRLEESAMWSAQGQFEQAKQWRSLNLLLGIPASALAAVSGITALASTAGRIPAGVIAIAAAAVGAVLTTLNAGQRAAKATAVANAYLEVQTVARQARLLDLGSMTSDQARTLIANLTAQRKDINASADPINNIAYLRAKRVLAAGGQDYEVDSARSSKPRP